MSVEKILYPGGKIGTSKLPMAARAPYIAEEELRKSRVCLVYGAVLRKGNLTGYCSLHGGNKVKFFGNSRNTEWREDVFRAIKVLKRNQVLVTRESLKNLLPYGPALLNWIHWLKRDGFIEENKGNTTYERKSLENASDEDSYELRKVVHAIDKILARGLKRNKANIILYSGLTASFVNKGLEEAVKKGCVKAETPNNEIVPTRKGEDFLKGLKD